MEWFWHVQIGFLWEVTQLHPTRVHHPLVFSAQYQTRARPKQKHVKHNEDAESSEPTAALYRSTPIAAPGPLIKLRQPLCLNSLSIPWRLPSCLCFSCLGWKRKKNKLHIKHHWGGATSVCTTGQISLGEGAEISSFPVSSAFPALWHMMGRQLCCWTPSHVAVLPTSYLNNHHDRNGRLYLNSHFFIWSFIRCCRNSSCIAPSIANHLDYPRAFLEMDFRTKEAPRLESLSLEIIQGLNCSDQYSASASLLARMLFIQSFAIPSALWHWF